MSEIQLEHVNTTTRKLQLVVPSGRLQQEMQQRMQRLQKTARVNGFRHGKVPLSTIRTLYGKDVLAETADKLANELASEAIQSHKLQPVSPLNVDAKPTSADSDWNFSVTFEVVPEFTIPDMSAVAIEQVHTSVEDSDLQSTLESICKNNPDWVKVDRAAKEGDTIELDMDFVLLVDGKPEDDPQSSGQEKKQRWLLSDNMPVPGMLKALCGMKAGEKKEADFPIPEDYNNAHWRNKTMRLNVALHLVEEPSYPEVSKELAIKLGIPEDSKDHVAELKRRILSDLEQKVHSQLQRINKEKLFHALDEAVKLELPQSLLDFHNVMLRRDMVRRYVDPKQFETMERPEEMINPEPFVEKARYQGSIQLLLERVISKQNIEASQEELHLEIEKIASEYDDPKAFVTQVMAHEEQKKQFAWLVLENKVAKWVAEQSKIETVNKTVDELFASAEEAQAAEASK